MSKAIASNARWKASTPASCSTRWTTSMGCSIPCASATSRASVSTKRCFPDRRCLRKTSPRMARTEFRKRGGRVSLDKIPTEPPKGITKEKARERFAALGEELFELQDALWGAKVNGVMVVLQGRDTAGKDGTIKHVAGCL